MYKAIGFDYGGVLNKSKSALPGIASVLGVEPEELKKLYYPLNFMANVESMSYEDLWTKIATDLGHGDKSEQVIAEIYKAWDFTINAEMIELIDKLRTDGYKVGLLSNNTRENGNKLREEGIAAHFDAFIISADIGYQKPSHEAFQALFDALDVKADETVFTDDSPSSLSLAAEIGYYPLLFTGYEKFESDLTNLGILK
jgi:HAD superfamily hydrolase (TIGR01509 family)